MVCTSAAPINSPGESETPETDVEVLRVPGSLRGGVEGGTVSPFSATQCRVALARSSSAPGPSETRATSTSLMATTAFLD